MTHDNDNNDKISWAIAWVAVILVLIATIFFIHYAVKAYNIAGDMIKEYDK